MAWDLVESKDGTIWVAGSGVRKHVTRITRKQKKYNLQEGQIVLKNFQQAPLFQNKNFVPENLQSVDFTIDARTNTLWTRNSYIEGESSKVILAAQNQQTGEADLYEMKGLQIKDTINGNFNNAGIAIAKDGKIWNTLNQSGIFSFDPTTNVVQQYLHNPLDENSLASNEIVRMLMDSDGKIWAANLREGLDLLNPKNGKITHFDFTDGHQKETIESFPIALLEDLEGMIWVGGMVLLKNEETRPFLAKINPQTLHSKTTK